MTSKRLFANLLKENSKRRLWTIALSIAANFFAQIVYAMLMFGHYAERLEDKRTNIEDIRIHFYNNIVGMGNMPVILTVLGLAFILALQGYYYLFDSRQTDLYYSLPVKRDKIFDANNLCGILVFAIPYLICNLITLIMGISRGYVAINAILLYPANALVVLLMFVMCYELCVLAAVLTGHIVVAVLGCGVFFFLGPVINAIYLLYMETFFSSYCNDYSYIGTFTFTGSPINLMLETIFGFQGDADHEIAFYTFDAAGCMLEILVLAAGAFLTSRILVKRRAAEAAGKAMAFSVIKPVFKIFISVIAALGAGLLMYFVGSTRSFGMFIFGMLCGLIIVHIVIETIYEFDFKASFKHYGTLIASAVISVFIFCGFVFDIVGYESWQPMPSRVESIAISDDFIYSDLIAPYEKTTHDTNFYNSITTGASYALANMKITDLEMAEKITRLGAIQAKNAHKDAIKYKLFSPDYINYDYNEYAEGTSPNYAYFSIQWNLKNGKKVKRRYKVDINDQELFAAYKDIYNSEEFKYGKFPVLGIEPGEINALKGQTIQGEFYKNLSEGDMDEFVKIYSEELKNQSFDDLKNDEPVLVIYGADGRDGNDYYSSTDRYNFYVFPSFTKTIAFLEKHEMPVTWWDGSDKIYSVSIKADRWNGNGELQYTEWQSGDKNEIQEVVKNVIPSELYQATGINLIYDDGVNSWKNVEFTVTSKLSTKQDYVYLINNDNLPEKLKTMCFSEEDDTDASVSSDGKYGWVKCVTNG